MEKFQLLQNDAKRVILTLPAYVTINDLHDAGGLDRVKSHLTKNGLQRQMSVRNSCPHAPNQVTPGIRNYGEGTNRNSGNSPWTRKNNN